MTADTNVIEWALRVCQSVAFAIHGILGVSEPFTGCVQHAFRDTHGAMPKWFWPVAGLLLWTVAYLNFSPNDAVVLGVQAYVAAFHMGGFFYHQRLHHHLAAGLVPAFFALLAFVIVAIRTGSVLIALVGWWVCTCIAFGLSKLLVAPPPSNGNEGGPTPGTNLLEGGMRVD
uniref:Uncharacterized protein n=1 Tax=Trieres chinensis TaxID=1514140 RepID=A0A7S2EC07_TRICV|mmetsp:Transcript_16955/g.34793  ORF Transcript_16955/g.34793 Transcript_16955/m.34793 type:complete len:172 (+) Transcript_16955:181-696(+)|eukprot:CAMPEP_0183304802 /NCGR_PEP_ID=MMETSP0160_2-20130417/9766_1 /TAXON_ID=2839 ORGANISM="Odontella Sinensis, Strain Grunow 1884" /NCGR_SAMPLE_ID=MMETSP0160_2 /ASSEMBLY_ACC=CAM_ASM_000250 /LENGTH=171 /DNA_ID=CAMNT_0025467917 /DNA_START=179 /DNA_END=694 /DNA_ORIENTATION=-